MNIIFGDTKAQELDEKYVVLELDIIKLVPGDQRIRVYGVVEGVPITEMHQIENFKNLHRELMENYAKRNWNFCEQALEHLPGKWKGELDSFYSNLYDRIQSLKTLELDDSWDSAIERQISGDVAPEAV